MKENQEKFVDSEPAYILIDPPVGPFSTEAEIKEWISELRKYPNRPEVRDAIRYANKLLKITLESNRS